MKSKFGEFYDKIKRTWKNGEKLIDERFSVPDSILKFPYFFPQVRKVVFLLQIFSLEFGVFFAVTRVIDSWQYWALLLSFITTIPIDNVWEIVSNCGSSVQYSWSVGLFCSSRLEFYFYMDNNWYTRTLDVVL